MPHSENVAGKLNSVHASRGLRWRVRVHAHCLQVSILRARKRADVRGSLRKCFCACWSCPGLVLETACVWCHKSHGVAVTTKHTLPHSSKCAGSSPSPSPIPAPPSSNSICLCPNDYSDPDACSRLCVRKWMPDSDITLTNTESRKLTNDGRPRQKELTRCNEVTGHARKRTRHSVGCRFLRGLEPGWTTPSGFSPPRCWPPSPPPPMVAMTMMITTSCRPTQRSPVQACIG